MGYRYSLDIVNNLIEIVFNVCERRELDGIVGMNEFQADYKMVYPIVDSLLWVMCKNLIIYLSYSFLNIKLRQMTKYLHLSIIVNALFR